MTRVDAGYYERRERLLTIVRRYHYGTCDQFARKLEWSSNETRAKLMSLRDDGLVYYNGLGEWFEEPDAR